MIALIRSQNQMLVGSNNQTSESGKDQIMMYTPLLTASGDIVTLPSEKLKIGPLSEQKIKDAPRFNGKVLRCPGNYYVIVEETGAKRSVYPHIRMLAYFLRFKLTKCLDSYNVKLSVSFYINCLQY